MKGVTLNLIAAVILVSSVSAGEKYFTVVGPKVLLTGQQYRCTVTFYESHHKDPIVLTVTVMGNAMSNGAAFRLSENATVHPKSNTKLTFATEKFPAGNYRIVVEGQEDDFYGQQELTFVPKYFSMFIQTDKALYKGDDTVKFRVFAVDFKTLSYTVKGVPTVTITDPAGNKVKEFSKVAFAKGKYESQLSLTSEPAIGTWQITVQAEGEVISKSFVVAEYVLPAFYATVSAPAEILAADGKFAVTVGAKYTFGQKVEGSATVTFKKWGNQMLHTRTVEITSASSTFDVDMIKDLGLTYFNWDHSISIEVEFTDKLTAKVDSASTKCTIISQKYKIFFNIPDYFKPGLPISYKVTVQKYDGSPAPAGSMFSVSTTFHYDSYNAITEKLAVGAAGTTEVVIANVPVGTTDIKIRINYEEVICYSNISPFTTYQNEFISLKVSTQQPSISQAVNVDVSTTENIAYAFYHIVSKGVLLDSKKVLIKKKKGSFSFTPSFAFAPKADIIIYYMQCDGEIITATTSIEFRSDLSNLLEISLAESIVKPGANAIFLLGTKCSSTVHMLATDSRTLLLKGRNDLSFDKVFNQLGMYNNQKRWETTFEPIWAKHGPNYDTFVKKFLKVNLAIVSNGVDHFPLSTYPPYDFPLQMATEMTTDNTQDTSPPYESSVRKDFSETFAWQTVDVAHKKNLTIKVPHSITSYIISGVSTSSICGLGLLKIRPELTVFLPFFLSMTLPYSVKRDETLRQEVYVYNYQQTEQTVTVYITKKSAEFEFVYPELNGWQNDATSYFQTFVVKPDSIQKLTFHLKAKTLGFVTLSVKAVGTTAGDAIEQKLRVVPEGIAKYITNSTIVLPRNLTASTTAELTCTLPPSAVSDTVSISASIVGDIMATSLNNLENLIQMPGGCGEQNMLNLVPDIAILRYLDASGKLTAAIKTKVVAYIEDGYQRELIFYRYDGSFSAFRDSDPSGSTWLTAFVAKSFVQAKNYITVDMNVVESSIRYLISKQNADGSFREDGNVIHKDMQGGSASGTSLTAYVANALSEMLSIFPQFTAQRDLAINYIAENYDSTNVYSLSIVSYALTLSNHASASFVRAKFNAMAFETTNEMYWKKTLTYTNFWAQSSSLDIEITAYGLMTNAISDVGRALKSVRWMVAHANFFGGYGSTQDTVMGLESLSKFAAVFASAASNLALKLTPNVGSIINVSVTKANALVLQSFNLNQSARKLGVLAPKGSTGIAIVSLSCNYYEVVGEQAPRFTIDHRLDKSCFGFLKSSICIAYIAKPNDTVSNMVLVRMKLPSGFVYDTQRVPGNVIKRVETNNGGSEVSIYINSVTESNACFYLNAIQVSYIEDLKSGTIEAFDYYDTSKKASKLFSVPKLAPCEPGSAKAPDSSTEEVTPTPVQQRDSAESTTPPPTQGPMQRSTIPPTETMLRPVPPPTDGTSE